MKLGRAKGGITIYHAPWSKLFKTMCYKGAFAYELQVGPVVIQWFYDRAPIGAKPEGKKLHIWRDRFWR